MKKVTVTAAIATARLCFLALLTGSLVYSLLNRYVLHESRGMEGELSSVKRSE
jgi:hypothetical protein